MIELVQAGLVAVVPPRDWNRARRTNSRTEEQKTQNRMLRHKRNDSEEEKRSLG